jgi:hypothetical protein
MSAQYIPSGQSLRHPSGSSRSCNITLFIFYFIFWIIWLAGIGGYSSGKVAARPTLVVEISNQIPNLKNVFGVCFPGHGIFVRYMHNCV